MSQTIKHSIYHIIHLDKEATVNADMIHHPPTEGLIDLPIGHDIQLFHTCFLQSVLLGITGASALILRRGDVEAVT